MAYKIKIPEDFRTLSDLPFKKVHLDGKGDPVPMKDEKTGKDKLNVDGEVLVDQIPASFIDVAKRFMDQAYFLAGAQSRPDAPLEKPDGSKPFTMNDISMATDITSALNIADRVLELEDAPYEWLMGKDGQKGMIDLYGPHPLVLGMNAQVFKNVFRLPPQPSEDDAVTHTKPTTAESKRNDKAGKDG